MKIVYVSNTGHTEQYAKMISDKLSLEITPITSLKTITENDDIIFISWVCAGNIRKLKKIRKYCTPAAVIAVGMTPKSVDNTNKLIESNKVIEPFFYLQGGINYDKLNFIKGKLLKMIGSQLKKENKPENLEMIEIFEKGGNFASEKKLDEFFKEFSKIDKH